MRYALESKASVHIHNPEADWVDYQFDPISDQLFQAAVPRSVDPVKYIHTVVGIWDTSLRRQISSWTVPLVHSPIPPSPWYISPILLVPKYFPTPCTKALYPRMQVLCRK